MLVIWQTFAIGGSDSPGFATITGSVTDSLLEHEVVVGWEDIVIVLSGNATWASGQTFNDARQAILDGLDSGSNEARGWNAEVRDRIELAAVTRINSTIVTILLPASSGYSVSANETITVTVPASAIFNSSNAITASPTFVVTADTQTGTEIVNTDSTTSVPVNYEICQVSGTRQLPSEIVKRWDGAWVREKSNDSRHPQEFLRSRSDKLIGSFSPEPDDTFLADGEVKVSDL